MDEGESTSNELTSSVQQGVIILPAYFTNMQKIIDRRIVNTDSTRLASNDGNEIEELRMLLLSRREMSHILHMSLNQPIVTDGYLQPFLPHAPGQDGLFLYLGTDESMLHTDGGKTIFAQHMPNLFSYVGEYEFERTLPLSIQEFSQQDGPVCIIQLL